MTTKEVLHRMVDAIPDEGLEEAKKALEPLADRLLLTLATAPIDDEPETDEERAMVEEARQELARGEHVSLEDVKRELGLAWGDGFGSPHRPNETSAGSRRRRRAASSEALSALPRAGTATSSSSEA